MIDVLVAGEIYLDLILSGFNALPEPGREVFATSFAREVGGGTAITASGLARLGLRCGVFGLVGSDSADWVKDRLCKQGVDTGEVHTHATEPTGFTVVATTAADRSFLSYQGANTALDATFFNSVISDGWSAAKHVHLAYAPSLARIENLCNQLQKRGATVSLDVGWREEWLAHPGALEALKHVDLFFPNLSEGMRITGETTPEAILNLFRKRGVSNVALKLGGEGSAFLSNDTIIFAKATRVDPVDTTGAGDCFDAGFIAAWLAGKDSETCLRCGNICGALSTLDYGGIAGFPTQSQLQQELTRFSHA